MKKEKKKGNGFVCRLIQAIILSLAAIGLIAVAVYMAVDASASFATKAITERYYFNSFDEHAEETMREAGLLAKPDEEQDVEEKFEEKFDGGYRRIERTVHSHAYHWIEREEGGAAGDGNFWHFHDEWLRDGLPKPHWVIGIGNYEHTQTYTYFYGDDGKVDHSKTEFDDQERYETESVRYLVFTDKVSDGATILFIDYDTKEEIRVDFSKTVEYGRYLDEQGENANVAIIFVIAAASVALLAALQFVFAFKGKKSKGANIACIVIDGILTPLYLFGLLGLIGGIKGLKRLKEAEKKEAATSESAERPAAQAEASGGVQTVQTASASGKTLADFPVDYEKKPAVSRLLDFENRENLVLKNTRGITVEFVQLYVTVYNENLYAVTETVGLSEEEGGGIVIFRIDYDEDEFHVEGDEAVCESVFNRYKEAVNGANAVEKRQIKRSEFKLDLYDASIDEKTWKEFKKTATQEELAVISIGAKYRIAHNRIKNLIYALGIILSIAIFWPTGGWSLIGYPIFAFLATKSIRYEDTYNQAYRKLTKENKALVDRCFNNNAGLTILDCIVKIAIFWITIPYQAILLLIGTFAPNFVIAKNGILVSIPNGYDVGGLGAIGEYYKSFDFIDESLSNLPQSESTESGSPTEDYYKKEEYTYTDKYGHEQTVYSDDGKDYYDAGGRYVGAEGKEFKKKD